MTRAPRRRAQAFEFAGKKVLPGNEKRFEFPVARDALGAQFSLQAVVLHGRRPGRRLWVNAATHGDEVGGIAIAGKLLDAVNPRELAGTLVVVPVVNVFGVMNRTRYLPDRRDLNRCFPGSERGSLGARVARLFLNEVVQPCEVGVDLHTGSGGRRNLPQIRVDLSDPEGRELALAFGSRVILDSRMRDGSLRAAARELGKVALVYEGGEALRWDRGDVEAGFNGLLRLMHHLGMIETSPPAPSEQPHVCDWSTWVRASRSGLVDYLVELGDGVERGQSLAVISDAFSTSRVRVKATAAGVVIGRASAGLVTRGDALYHVASP